MLPNYSTVFTLARHKNISLPLSFEHGEQQATLGLFKLEYFCIHRKRASFLSHVAFIHKLRQERLHLAPPEESLGIWHLPDQKQPPVFIASGHNTHRHSTDSLMVLSYECITVACEMTCHNSMSQRDVTKNIKPIIWYFILSLHNLNLLAQPPAVRVCLLRGSVCSSIKAG